MEVKNMRWGYDGGGLACGPAEGTYNVEIMVTGDDHHNYFIIDGKFCEEHKIYISEIPLFDLVMSLANSEVDFDYELNKIESHSLENYDFEDGEIPKEIKDSKFAKLINILINITNEYVNGTIPKDVSAKEYISNYIKD